MIRGIFPCPADRHLHQHRTEGREDHDRQHANDAAPAIPVTTEEKGEVGEHTDGPRQCRRHRHGQGIAVPDMREFMGDDTGKFLLSHDLHQTAGDGHRRIFRVAPRCKGIGLRVVHDEDLRHRQFRPHGQIRHQTHKRRCLLLRYLARAIHLEHHLVGVPIGESVHADGNDKGNNHARRTAD